MKQFLTLIFLILLVHFVSFVYPLSTNAASVAYKVTDGFTAQPSGRGSGVVFFRRNMPLNYSYGKMILSSNPDGTGEVSIGDMIQIIGNNRLFTFPLPIGSHSCSMPDIKLPPTDITHMFNLGFNNILVRFSDWCNYPKSIGPVYIVNTDLLDPGPTPFLDLPWDYASQGKSFEEIALNPSSWYDHQYPLQDTECCVKKVLTYVGIEIDDYYRSHSGYDYASQNGVKLNTPVVAAASGWATFVPATKSGGAGNVIKIDHGNSYQTWYEHLSKDGLLVNDEETRLYVSKGTQIGKVGMTGYTTGPHLHFSVFKDINENGTFDDDYPYGLVDPLGWDSEHEDPWTLWGENNTFGANSYNLFLSMPSPKEVAIPATGGNMVDNNIQISVPPGAAGTPFTLKYKKGPFITAPELLNSIFPSMSLRASNSFGEEISVFLRAIGITVDYKDADLSNIIENTLKVYHLNEQTKIWEPLPTTLDITSKTIHAETTHFSQFAVLGKIKDVIAPVTTVTVDGSEGQDNWYNSDVVVHLTGKDNDEGLGLEYTLYSLNGSDWFVYDGPLTFTSEGLYTIQYLSIDKADNREERKSLEFFIDKTFPQVTINASQTDIWPPNGKFVDVLITGTSSDAYLQSTDFQVEDEYKEVEPELIGFGNSIKLLAQREGNDKDGRVYTIKALAKDKAGNISEDYVSIVVPHDKSN